MWIQLSSENSSGDVRRPVGDKRARQMRRGSTPDPTDDDTRYRRGWGDALQVGRWLVGGDGVSVCVVCCVRKIAVCWNLMVVVVMAEWMIQ